MRYDKMSTAELRAVARRDGIEDYDKMSKEDLFDELCELDELHCEYYDYRTVGRSRYMYGYIPYAGYRTISELRFEARLRGLSGYSKMCKAKLVELLELDFYNEYGDNIIRGEFVHENDTNDARIASFYNFYNFC